jgi:hypothetical protein
MVGEAPQVTGLGQNRQCSERTDPRHRHQPAAVGIARQNGLGLLRNALAHAAQRQLLLEFRSRSASVGQANGPTTP